VGDEVAIDEAMVRALLRSQHPDLADLPLSLAGRGWDNLLHRLGDDLLVRLPTRELAAPLAAFEHRWLPELGPRLPLPTPVPVRVGEPAPELGYPWRWSVTPWFEGRPALHEPPADLDRAADQLAAFVTALAQPAPPEAPPNPYRGVPLADRSVDTEPRLADLAAQLGGGLPTEVGFDHDTVLACWRHHVDLPRWDGAPRWLHGDLHPLNLVVRDGVLAAVIDFGDVTSGDPATDLFIGWMLFGPRERARLRAGVTHLDEHGWGRARGWALCMAIAYLANATPANQLRPLGAATVRSVVEEWAAER
jgi:aminoglycoside phosphotransferase (APT) family kinase protein